MYLSTSGSSNVINDILCNSDMGREGIDDALVTVAGVIVPTAVAAGNVGFEIGVTVIVF